MRLVVAMLVSLGLTTSGSFAVAQTPASGAATAPRAQSGDEGRRLPGSSTRDDAR